MFNETIARLELALQGPLPGNRAHLRMMPQPPRGWPPDFDTARVRQAAGLLLLFPVNDQAHIILTVRAGTLERHRGQVSLPGGAVDTGETFVDTALREAQEEIGLDLTGVRPLGALTPLDIPVSGFRLHPIVAARPERPTLHPAAGEVAEILEVPIAWLADESSIRVQTRTRESAVVSVPTFVLDHVEIWGATAMVLAELVEMIRM